ncbi:Aste57867_20060 [Aphanomyces stellatus]|uniref:Aste57867_20060 protein n=1 Tax=Aphanomyces stellatus TaxID=120398 RepID=A0A485LE41_9STRA|nr:hypothetical protein As57867_019994 [Aphanomyces stellatus]VFT96756.1 Aste57867_20060 [Aphanomyces stellatus]
MKTATFAVLALAALAAHAQYNVKDQILDQTNKIRAAHGVPPIAYDDATAVGMQQWADTCPGFEHGGPSGWQNLASYTPCGGANQPDCTSLVGAAWMWYDQEETKWNYDNNQCNNGDWATCGHFSNMMSPSVKSIACGWSSCANGDFVWCNYDAAEEKPTVPRNALMSKDQLKASLTQVGQPSVAPRLSTAQPAPSTDAPIQVTTVVPSSRVYGMKDQLLDQTNKLRAAHGISPVTWDAAFAVGVQQWADTCPGFEHGGPMVGGQNLASYVPCGGTNQPDCATLEGGAWIWYDDEESMWNYDSKQCNNGDWATCGHFSNMMSPSVKSIACGWSSCPNGDYVWCNYNSPEESPAVPRNVAMTKDALRATLTQVVRPSLAPSTAPPATDAPTTTAAPTAAPTLPTTTLPWPTKNPRPSTSQATAAPQTSTAKPSPVMETTAAPVATAYGMKEQLIDQTNKIRAAHGLGPVTWDAKAATDMQQWADSCPGFKHGGPSGWQNLASNTPCGGANQPDCGSLVGAAWMWYNQEETKWNYDSNQCNNGDWATCGHFSNMMSPSVKSIACGWSACANGNYVWCNYNTPVQNPSVPRISGMSKDDLKAKLIQKTDEQQAPSATTSTPAVTSSPVATPSSAQGKKVPAWGQCGGAGWKGATVCVDGTTCVKNSGYYSMCVPRK